MITYAEAPHLEEFIANIDIQEIFTPEQGSHINPRTAAWCKPNLTLSHPFLYEKTLLLNKIL